MVYHLAMKDIKKSPNVRFPVHVWKQIHEVAHQNNRSLNGEILTAIEEYLKQKERKKETGRFL